MINYTNLEQQNINSKEQKEYLPILEFDSYIPDDFLHAPTSDIWFSYHIKDPITGEDLIDPTTNLQASNFVAYSVEYNGEYYWTYNVYYEEVDGLTPTPGSEDLIDKFSPVKSKIFLPQSMGESWNINVESVERNLSNGDIDLGLTIQTTYPTLMIDDYNINTGEYSVVERPSYDIDINENFYIYANNNLIFEQGLTLEYLFYELTSMFPPEISFIEERKGVYDFELNIDYSLIQDDELELKIISEKTPSYIEVNDEYLLADSADQTERFVIPTNQESFYNITFNGSSMNKTISIPYYWEGVEKKWESFTFDKLFENYYKYPTTTKDLLRVSYSDGVNTTFPDNEISSTLKINIENYPVKEMQLKKRYEGNDVIFYVDDDMHYDYENEVVVNGVSDNEKFTNEKGIVLSWDEVLNGEIEFTFTATTYKEYMFDVKLKIGNTNKLRGNGGLYEIEEI